MKEQKKYENENAGKQKSFDLCARKANHSFLLNS